MYCRFFFFSTLFLLFSFDSNAQKLNHLLSQLDTVQNDAEKVDLYADISRYYCRVNLDTCKMYADSVGIAAQKINNEEFIKRVDYYNAVCEQNAGNYDAALT